MVKRKQNTAELKAKVALSAIRADGTTRGDHQAELKELRAKIGELVVERDFLQCDFGR